MSITFGLYDDETREALLMAIEAAMEKGLEDDLILAEMAEEIGLDFDDDSRLTRRGQLAVAMRIPVRTPAQPAKPIHVQRFRQRLSRRAAELI